MHGIQSNQSSAHQPQSSLPPDMHQLFGNNQEGHTSSHEGTQEDGIVKQKNNLSSSKYQSSTTKLRKVDPSADSKNINHEDHSEQFLHNDPKEISSTYSKNPGTARGGVSDEFQQASHPMTSGSLITKEATEHITQSIQGQLSGMTLKMEPVVISSGIKTNVVNENGAPALPIPAPIVIEETEPSSPLDTILSSNAKLDSEIDANLANNFFSSLTNLSSKASLAKTTISSDIASFTQGNSIGNLSSKASSVKTTISSDVPSSIPTTVLSNLSSKASSANFSPPNKVILAETNSDNIQGDDDTTESPEDILSQVATTTPSSIIADSAITSVLAESFSLPSSKGTSPITSKLSQKTTSTQDPLGTTTTTSQDQFNVYKILEQSGIISTQSQLNAVIAAVAGATAQENIEETDMTNQINDINTSIQDSENASNEAGKDNGLDSAMNITNIVLGSVSILAGLIILFVSGGTAAPLAAILIISGVSMILMATEGQQMIDGLADGLTEMYASMGLSISPEMAQIMAVIVLMVLMTLIVCIAPDAVVGLAEGISVATRALSTGAEAALITADEAGEISVSDATTAAEAAEKAAQEAEKAAQVAEKAAQEAEAETANNLQQGLKGFQKYITELNESTAFKRSVTTIQIANTLIQNGLNEYQAVINLKVAGFQQAADDLRAAGQLEGAYIQQMESFIELTNQFNNTILKTVDNTISQYGSTLSGMTSGDPLDNLTHSRA